MSAVLVANRGEIAIRVLRAAADLGLRTVAVYSEDDATSSHVGKADEAHALRGGGTAAYLDADQLIALARSTGCSMVHPGYGFLSENAEFAARCSREGLRFVGPDPEVLHRFGDKLRARELATELGVPVLPGTTETTARAAAEFLAGLGAGGAVMVKALSGGGGRGMRPAGNAAELESAFERAGSEARGAFGDGAVYVEQYLPRARHIEVQILGDGRKVTHLGERDCSIQRRRQKLIEVAPAPAVSAALRHRITTAAVRMAERVNYDGVGTFEFLVDTDSEREESFFLEANPRLQVEHTVTEEITGVDLVQAQLRIAAGAGLDELGLHRVEDREPNAFALQARVNLETTGADGTVYPATGTLTAFEPPSGPGVRVDSHGYTGYHVGARFDSLLAKVVVQAPGPDFAVVARRAHRALGEFVLAGPEANVPLLRAVLAHPEFVSGDYDTGFLERHHDELRAAERAERPPEPADAVAVDERFPDAVAMKAPTGAVVLDVRVGPDEPVRRGQPLVVLEAMKMEHVVAATGDGTVRHVAVHKGYQVDTGTPMVFLAERDAESSPEEATDAPDVDEIPPNLHQVRRRHAVGLDEARAQAVERRHGTGRRTARENLRDLCDEGTFVEYGALTVAAQRRRRPVSELIERTPADGLVAGVGHVNGERFGPDRSRCVVMSYDYTVLAGTQGLLNHRKTDRMLEVAERKRLPVVLFAEGGGGRPGDTDTTSVSGLDVSSFQTFGRLSGLVPLVGIVAGRCFAGNAALLGCCDVVIATRDATIGMGGPAMIEGGGLGSFAPEEVGPSDVQSANGVIDVLVDDEAEAVAVAKRYLSYFQGDVAETECADQRLLRHVVPENRRRVYDVRTAVDGLADTGSVLELRRAFAPGAVTALVRVEGRPLGLVANDPAHLGGAIDRDAADKMARFLRLCEAFGLPVISLCDTPGFMVGPESERTATVRHFSRLFVTGANLTVPMCTIVLRKGYGLGAQAMAGGSFAAPTATVSWPTGEIGAMGLEGSVRLGYRRELADITDPEQRQREFDRLVDEAYEQGKALNAASVFELDDVIDPADTRTWITETLAGGSRGRPHPAKRVPYVDTW
ncbi:acetyl/propionyl-CoA carboxylase alpha subunit/acetyl-CoA carboxylase carboxyltransferase component [Saccharopolyspora lacisalsi]|uniref:Acetyl/propionyl-CoA carboxylase alpha subunit/acetyl-CoA carboxylase carboxyltransferase component n=1 Tax=Halosaccharopolyspora lacisalsi TaxID=1000566 RepID=A0A839DSV8_9PSEU|nr:carboxyl transferase domain-containing protein [Halosaccharopolyspora lacisalsi]MBA8824594.1 acetyl/propionyl-CoA carboxylase alpha subunit/acetyl-CoA carboxylase carboxyltransferase component [Halosaccharopolyspora lacisalsi]